jgi:hypothetical protein
MPVVRYFLYVGGGLIALLFAIGAILPQEAAVHSAPGIDRSTVRIRSDQKLPERVVYDTTLPTIVPSVAKVQNAAAAEPATSAQTRVRETFAQFVPGDPKKAEQGVVKAEQVAAKTEHVAAPKKRKIARARWAPPGAYALGGPPMRIAQQQQRFGFFGGPMWNTW